VEKSVRSEATHLESSGASGQQPGPPTAAAGSSASSAQVQRLAASNGSDTKYRTAYTQGPHPHRMSNVGH
jgi:hypothetical protein